MLQFIFQLLDMDRTDCFSSASSPFEMKLECEKFRSDKQVRARHIIKEEKDPYIKELMENRMNHGIYDFSDLRPEKYK